MKKKNKECGLRCETHDKKCKGCLDDGTHVHTTRVGKKIQRCIFP